MTAATRGNRLVGVGWEEWCFDCETQTVWRVQRASTSMPAVRVCTRCGTWELE